MRKKKRFVGLTLICIIIATVILGVLCVGRYNSTSLKSGKIYYCTNEGAFTYDLKTKQKKEVDISGINYDFINYYLPLNEGYLACIESAKNNTAHYLMLYNGSVVYESDAPMTQFTKENEFLIFTEGSNMLQALDLQTLECITVTDKAYYGYAFVDNVLYCNERDPFIPEEENTIFVLYFENGVLKREDVDSGIIMRNTISQMIYKKGKDYYSYDLTLKKPVLLDDLTCDTLLVEDTFENRYLGCINAKGTNYQIHFRQLKMTPYDNSVFVRSEENGLRYESEAMQDNKQEILCSTGFVTIKHENEVLRFPATSLSSNSSYISVVAFETDNSLIYPDTACTYHIY